MPSRSSDRQGRISAVQFIMRSAVRSRFTLVSHLGDNASLSFARGAVARAALFLVFWLMISGWAPTDLPVGLAAVVGATWVSLRFLPPKGSRFRVGSLVALAASFLRQSVVSGTDVAWRALNPRLRLDPGLVACPLRLPPGGQRSAFCALSSLMPGTLPTGTDERGALLVHCLDIGQPVAANLAAEERLFIRAVGGD
jgi:multicomponent Na+:H+ antiporter subunit E